jgi:MoaA/NifB/PqqE/SkfB family radical SAM enzyme
MVHRYKLNHLPDRFPLACQWEITCRCNLHCVMCYTDCFNRPEKIRQELSTDEILRIMDELAEAGCLELCLTGGEPLTRPDFFQLYEHATRRGFLVTLFTNGTLITEPVADRLAALPPHRIEISLHGLTEDTFEKITLGRGSFQRCSQAIAWLIKRRIPLTLKTTAMTLNHQEILAIKQYVQGLGSVHYKLGEDMRPALDGSGEPFQFAMAPAALDDLNKQDPQLWNEACRKQAQDTLPCRSGMQRFHIDAYGFLQLCSGNRAQGYDLRKGSFMEGFYDHLPAFGCRWKPEAAPVPLYPGVTHA